MPTEAATDSPQQQIQKIIADCGSFIQHAQAKIETATNDNQVMGWLEINFQHNASILAACNVSATLQGPKDHFKNELPRLRNGLQHLENDIGNLAADFKLNQTTPATTLPRARQLEAEYHALRERTEAAFHCCKLLREAHVNLCANLTPQTLLPIAKSKSGDKGPIFEIGYKLYRLTSDHKSEEKEEKTLDDFFSEATRQETLFAQMTLSELPKLAATVIKEQIKAVISIIATLKNGIDLLRETFASEHKHVSDTEARIAKLSKKELSALLTGINEEAEALYKGMLRFHYKAHHMDKFYDTEEILLIVQFLQRAIKKDLQRKLKKEISTIGNPLNPATAASTAADHFFKGSKGFWRGVKLLFGFLLGKPAVNLTNFETTIREALNSCDTFYGDTPEDILPLETFIKDKLSAFDAPFPNEDLTKIMKKCLYDYGTAIEYFCLTFKVDISSLAGKKGKISIKKLISQIKKTSDKLLQ